MQSFACNYQVMSNEYIRKLRVDFHIKNKQTMKIKVKFWVFLHFSLLLSSGKSQVWWSQVSQEHNVSKTCKWPSKITDVSTPSAWLEISESDIIIEQTRISAVRLREKSLHNNSFALLTFELAKNDRYITTNMQETRLVSQGHPIIKMSLIIHQNK